VPAPEPARDLIGGQTMIEEFEEKIKAIEAKVGQIRGYL
jgi:hypothetical protein